jgi:hypothetical protein
MDHPPIYYIEYITRDYANEHSDYLFIFGDNDMRTGLGGLAREVRGQPNAIGIRVKKKPSMTTDSFYNDCEIESNRYKLDQDFQNLRANWNNNYVRIVAPVAGIGTGRAELRARAPKTYEYLINLLVKHGFEYPL